MVSVVGFAVTIWQLLRTKRSVDAANDAAAALRSRISSQTATMHAAAAIARIKAAKRELRSKEWAAAQVVLEELRQSLLIVERRKHITSEKVVDELPSYLKDLLDYVDYIDRLGESEPVAERQKKRMLTRLNELSNLLEKIADDLSENVQ
ncbi:MAG: hypothetical protein EOP50_13680 [Sphingobacteriales bacterium]|nr:MAG: hypothetical protein EOP50_13680 [Sphingobacteriales bacterium]